MLKKVEYGDKILLIAKAIGVSHYALGEEIDVKAPTMQSYVNKGVEPKLDFFRKLLIKVPNLNPEWFFFDRGNILNGPDVNINEQLDKMELKHLRRENELLSRIDELSRKVERMEKELSSIKSPGESVSSKHELRS